MIYYKIVGPNCGRDKTGKFTCVCGKCEPMTLIQEVKMNLDSDFSKVFVPDPEKTDEQNIRDCILYMEAQLSMLCAIEMERISTLKKRDNQRNNSQDENNEGIINSISKAMTETINRLRSANCDTSEDKKEKQTER